MSWTNKYKKSIDCNNPKGFSQKAHCRARKLRQMGKETQSKSINENETQDKEELKVGAYQTRHFDMCPGASSLYADIGGKGVDMDLAERAAKLQDVLFHLEKHTVQEMKKSSEEDVKMAENLRDQIMEMAKMMGLEKEHSYLQSHVDAIKKVLDKEEVNEDLRKWFREKWVNLAKPKKGGGYEECGTSGDKEGYAKCVPAAKAASMSKKEIKSAIRRKRVAQRKAGRPGKDQPGQGNKPIMVKTMREEIITEKNKPTKPALWSKAKSLAKSKFDVYPSAYANAWAAKWYRKRGGGWRKISEETSIVEKIRHEDDKWIIYSKDGSKKLGTYDTEKEAKKRLRQIEYFKHMKEELGPENEWGTPELTKKMMDATPGQGKDAKKMYTFKEFVDVTAETAIVHEKLNPVAWDDEMNLKPAIREALLKVARDFISTWDMEFPVTDIILTGSNANYNWTKFSDFDVHVVVNMGETGVTHDLVKNLLNAKKNLYNNQHNIRVKGHDVEVYAQDRSEHHVASGQYSLMNDRWLVVPTRQRPNFAYTTIQKKAGEIIQQADRALKENDVDVLRGLLRKIARMRKSGLERAGEFSEENMAFKVIRNSGMIEKIRQRITDLTDLDMSMNGDTSTIGEPADMQGPIDMEEALTPAGRVKKQINIRKNRWKLKKYAKIRPGISASQRRIQRRTQLTTVRNLYKNLAGVKNRKNLSSTQKSALERLVKTRGKSYRKSYNIKNRPQLRTADIKRVTKATKYKA